MIDGHNDLPWAMYKLCGYDLDAVDLAGGVPQLHTDIPRLRAGGVSGQFWSVFVPSSLVGDAAVTATLRQIDFVHRMVDRYQDVFVLARTADEVASARDSGLIASLMGMEGGHSIGGSLAVLRMMFRLGVRYMTLTHNDNVEWADSATDDAVIGGLSPFGEDIVREMNSLGMLVDLSHVSGDVMRQALAVTRAPVMFSHSCARAVCDVPRNVPDDVLATLAANGGVCMVAFVPDFLSLRFAQWYERARELASRSRADQSGPGEVGRLMLAHAQVDPPPAVSVQDVVAHLEHVREVAGIDHIGIGGDFDGSAFMPADLNDVSTYPRLLTALTSHGWSAVDLEKLCRGNILRVLRNAEEVSRA